MTDVLYNALAAKLMGAGGRKLVNTSASRNGTSG